MMHLVAKISAALVQIPSPKAGTMGATSNAVVTLPLANCSVVLHKQQGTEGPALCNRTTWRSIFVGFQRSSESRNERIFPRETAMPRFRAAAGPLFSCVIHRIRSPKDFSTDCVSSVEPSSTTMTSRFEYVCSRILTTALQTVSALL